MVFKKKPLHQVGDLVYITGLKKSLAIITEVKHRPNGLHYYVRPVGSVSVYKGDELAPLWSWCGGDYYREKTIYDS